MRMSGRTRVFHEARRFRWHLLAYVALTGTVCACSGSTPSESVASSSGGEGTRAAPGARAVAPEPDLAAHMRASFWMAVRARDSLIDGDLAAAQRAADTLADQDYSKLVPADWKHWVGPLQQHARELSIAPNVAQASQELGRIALVCGDCHDQHRRGPERVRTPPEPWRDPPEQLAARMDRHQIGVEQIWDGLVQPSEEAFRSGTVTLTRAPLHPALREGEPIDPALSARIEEVRGLARQARAARTYEERARVYGELIARCATCHTFARPAP